jgi:hypothetical protein
MCQGQVRLNINPTENHDFSKVDRKVFLLQSPAEVNLTVSQVGVVPIMAHAHQTIIGLEKIAQLSLSAFLLALPHSFIFTP